MYKYEITYTSLLTEEIRINDWWRERRTPMKTNWVAYYWILTKSKNLICFSYLKLQTESCNVYKQSKTRPKKLTHRIRHHMTKSNTKNLMGGKIYKCTVIQAMVTHKSRLHWDDRREHNKKNLGRKHFFFLMMIPFLEEIDFPFEHVLLPLWQFIEDLLGHVQHWFEIFIGEICLKVSGAKELVSVRYNNKNR